MPKELEDTDVMPFGKYAKTRTLMMHVPASYFHYLWTKGLSKETKTSNVARYIQKNLEHMKKEHPDGIWD